MVSLAPKKLPKVLVRWLDSRSYPEWLPTDLIEFSLATCESVGFLKESNREKIVLLQSVSDDKSAAALVIPKKVVLSQKILGRRVGRGSNANH